MQAPAKKVNGGKALSFAVFTCSNFPHGNAGWLTVHLTANRFQAGSMLTVMLLKIRPLTSIFILVTMYVILLFEIAHVNERLQIYETSGAG